MNVYPVSRNPSVCAKVLDDKLLALSIKDITNVLSNCLNMSGISMPIKTSETGHTFLNWTAKSYDNYKWTLSLLICLIREFKYRFPDELCPQESKLEYFNKIGVSMWEGLIKQQFYDWYYDSVYHNTNRLPNFRYKYNKDVYKANWECLLHKWKRCIPPPTWGGKEIEERKRTYGNLTTSPSSTP